MSASGSLKKLQEELAEWRAQRADVLKSIEETVATDELTSILEDVNTIIADTEAEIAQLEASQPPSPPPPPPPPAQAAEETSEKWSKKDHPAFQPGFRRTTDSASAPPQKETVQAPFEIHVNDEVLAQWISGDKSFYAAKITSITGSSADPIIQVKFKKYNATETLRRANIKPLGHNNPAKSNAKNSSDPTTTLPKSSNVITGAPSVNPDLVNQAKRSREESSEKPSNSNKAQRKMFSQKVLEEGRSKWESFQAKGKMHKGPKKESMFRTSDNTKAKVGVINSGNAMRKDAARQRNAFKPSRNEDDDE